MIKYNLFLYTQIYVAKLLISFNLGLFGLILLCTFLIEESHLRLTVVGWICATFTVCAFAVPLSIMVILTLQFKTEIIHYLRIVN